MKTFVFLTFLTLFGLHLSFLTYNSQEFDLNEFIKFFSLFLMIYLLIIINISPHTGFICWAVLLIAYSLLGLLSIIYFYDYIYVYYTQKGKIILNYIGRTPGDAGVWVYFLFYTFICYSYYMNQKKRLVLVFTFVIPLLMLIGGRTVLGATLVAALGYIVLIKFKKYFHLVIYPSFFMILFAPVFLFSISNSQLLILADQFDQITTSRSWLWQSFIADFRLRSFLDQFVGLSFDRREIHTPAMKPTSDLHSTVYDIINYFGVAGLLYIYSLLFFCFVLARDFVKPLLLGLATFMIFASIFKLPGTIPLIVFMIFGSLCLKENSYSKRFNISNSSLYLSK